MSEPDIQIKGGVNVYHRNIVAAAAVIGRGVAWGGFWIGLGIVIAAGILHG